MKPTAFSSIILLTGAVCMANPAVSEFNGKFGALHGSMDSESITIFGGLGANFRVTVLATCGMSHYSHARHAQYRFP
jgi:hypothetical protein